MSKIVGLLEKQIAVDLHFRGVNQQAIAKVLQKSKTYVNELLRDLPKGDER